MKVTTNNSLLQFIKLVKSALNGKASTSHTHDNRYYTESEIDTKLNGKSDTSHTHNYVKDIGNAANTTFAYSKAGLNYGDYTWLAGWNSNELRAINKSQFAQASHTHNYAGSSTAGGSATSAVKLDSSAGSATQPVYFSSGKPVACTYTLGKSVPSNAKFTDTTYGVATTTSNGLMSSTDKKKLDSINASGTFTLDGTTLNITSTSTIFSLSGTTLTITSE